MKRFAANYIACRSVDRLHYVEVTCGSVLNGVFPLEKELAGTSFLNGVIWVVPAALGWEVADVWSRLTAIHQQMPDASVPEMLKVLIDTLAVPTVGELPAFLESSILDQDGINNEQPATYLPVQGKPVSLFLIRGIRLSAAEFGANNSGGNRYVERL
ncbi:MAG: hypothetical protein AB7E53_04540 [Macellibacteroides sp.]|uniref:hypothetical protein n=1 Tax=Macellibacteroides sp. TaxID=2014584 RepID=UPI003E7B0534